MNMPRTKLIPNGDNIVHTFTETEYMNRQARLRQHMAANNIDVVIFTSIHGINYYSDFLYCSFGRPYALVLTQEKATTVSATLTEVSLGVALLVKIWFIPTGKKTVTSMLYSN